MPVIRDIGGTSQSVFQVGLGAFMVAIRTLAGRVQAANAGGVFKDLASWSPRWLVPAGETVVASHHEQYVVMARPFTVESGGAFELEEGADLIVMT